MPGVREAYHVVDPVTGNGMFTTQSSPRRVPHPAPKSETIYQVIRSG